WYVGMPNGLRSCDPRVDPRKKRITTPMASLSVLPKISSLASVNALSLPRVLELNDEAVGVGKRQACVRRPGLSRLDPEAIEGLARAFDVQTLDTQANAVNAPRLRSAILVRANIQAEERLIKGSGPLGIRDAHGKRAKAAGSDQPPAVGGVPPVAQVPQHACPAAG